MNQAKGTRHFARSARRARIVSRFAQTPAFALLRSQRACYAGYSKFFRVCSKNIYPGKLHCPFFVPEKLARLFVMREVKPSADRKMIKLVTVHNLFNYDNLANLKNLLFSENF